MIEHRRQDVIKPYTCRIEVWRVWTWSWRMRTDPADVPANVGRTSAGTSVVLLPRIAFTRFVYPGNGGGPNAKRWVRNGARQM